MFVAERLLLGLVKIHGRQSVSMVGGTWYPQQCRILNLKHHFHSPFEKSIIERTIQYIKDIQKLVEFYGSTLGQVIYSRRQISIEPLIEYIKSTFRIDPVPVTGLDNLHGIILLVVLLYQILVYYNRKVIKNDNSRKHIKYMIGY